MDVKLMMMMMMHCLGIIEAIKNNRQINHMAVEQRSGFY